MRKCIVTWLVFVLYAGFSTPSHAQNLVLNPSFEEMKGCPGPAWGAPTIDSAIHCFNMIWQNPITGYASPDYIHECVNPYVVSPFTYYSNPMWVEYPHTGIAMAGFYTYASPSLDAGEYREYVGMTLSEYLQKDTTYYVSLYVSRADSLNYATDINIYFAWNKIMMPDYYYGSIDSTAQVTSPHTITNDLGWTKIEGSFVAKGGEKYLIIGNLNTDAKTKIKHMSNYSYNGDTLKRALAYYIVDDVCISTKAQDCGVNLSNNIENKFNANSALYILYPNPTSEKVFLRGQETEVYMLTWYNSVGNKVKYSEVQSGEGVDVSDLPKGVYVAHIQGKKGFATQKMLIY